MLIMIPGVTAGYGDESPQSITSFSETLPDDVLFYPDAFYDPIMDYCNSSSTVNQGAETNSYTDTQATGGNAWESYDGTEEYHVEFYMLFTIPDLGGSIDGIGLNTYVKYTGASGGWSIDINFWDGAAWVGGVDETDAITYTWVNTTSYDAGTWSSNTIKVRVRCEDANDEVTLYIDYAEITIDYMMTLSDSDHYAESFAGVDDWSEEANTANAASFTTNGDILDFSITFDDAGNEYAVYATDISLTIPAGGSIEYRYKIDNATAVNGYFRMHDGVNLISGGLASELDSEDWETVKVSESEITDADYDAGEELYIWIYLDDAPAEIDSGTYHMWFDYARVSPSNEAGWQHDGSTIEGFAPQNEYCVLSTDGDLLNFSADGETAFWDILFDPTATLAYLDPDYYQFSKYKIDSVHDDNSDGNIWTIRYYFDGGNYYAPPETDIAGTFYENLLAGAGGSNDRYKIRIWCNADEWFTLDYFKIYSIANFTVSQSGVGTDDYLYVDSGTLYSHIDEGYIEANHDPTLDIGTHYGWDLNTSFISPEVDFYDGAWLGYSSETEGEFTLGTTITDFRLKFTDTENIISLTFTDLLGWNPDYTVTVWFDMIPFTGNLNMLLIFGGLIMIPASTLYIVKGGRSEMSSDKLFYFLIAFIMGWALVIGGIYG